MAVTHDQPRHSIVTREPWFAYDLVLFACVLAGIYANSAVAAAVVFFGSGAGYVYLRTVHRPPKYAARSLDLARSLSIAADAGLSGEDTARALAPFAPGESLDGTLRAAGDCAPLLAPAVRSGQLVPHASAYLQNVSGWLTAYVAARDAVAGQLRPSGLATVVMPTLSVFVFVGQLACIPWAQLTGNDPVIPLVMVGMMAAWLAGLVWQYRLLEAFHAGTRKTRTALNAALTAARGGNLPAIIEERHDIRHQVGESLITQAASIDRAECELVAMRFQMACVLTRAPAMAMALAFPLMLVAAAIGRLVGP